MSDDAKTKSTLPPCNGILTYGLMSSPQEFTTMYVGGRIEKIKLDQPEPGYDEGIICIPYPPKKEPKATPPNGSATEKSEVILKPKPDQKLKKEVLKEKGASPAPLHRSPIARPVARTVRAESAKTGPVNK